MRRDAPLLLSLGESIAEYVRSEVAKILIVEDEPVLALELSQDLRAAGHQVLGVESNSDMAVFRVSQLKPDVIIMDIKLYGFRDGIEAASQIRAFYKIPIVYLSSYTKSEVMDRVRRTLPAWYLQKPYDQNLLIRTLDGVLEGSLAYNV